VMAEIVARIRGVRVRRKGEEEVAEIVQGGEGRTPKVAERVEVQLSEAGCALPERGGS
jgi:xanthine dehydrogenase accessory factor